MSFHPRSVRSTSLAALLIAAAAFCSCSLSASPSDFGKKDRVDLGDGRYYDPATDSIVAGSFGEAASNRPAAPTDIAAWTPTPPMGWNSWDCYGPTVTEAEVLANADYMEKNLKSLGWHYVVVDITWYVANATAHGYQKNPDFALDANGRFIPAPNRFPSSAGGKGFKPLADAIHAKGLKFGIHIMRGVPQIAVEKNLPIAGSTHTTGEITKKKNTAPWLKQMWEVDTTLPGAQDYYDSIFRLYAEWGVDYVKVDDCSKPYYWSEIEAIHKAIEKTGRPIVLSLSPGATPLVDAEHVARFANLWRIQDDFWDQWRYLKVAFVDCANWAAARRRGHWPDADMLPLGRIGIRAERGDDRQTRFTPDEQRTLMSLWSIFQSPLMFGGDLPSNTPETLALITNPEVLAVDQAGFNGRQLFRDGDKIGWIADAPVAGVRYLALFNAGDAPAPLAVKADLAAAGFRGKTKIRDLWERKDLGEFEGSYETNLPRHGAALYSLTDAP